MLYKQYGNHNDKWRYAEWRYFCECQEPGHVLVFMIDEDERMDLDVAIVSNDKWSLWKRIKEAFKLIFGQEVHYVSVMINPADREELAAAIRSGYEEPGKGPDGQSGDQGQAPQG